MPLNGSDREFAAYTAEKVDSLVDQAITHLERQIEQLRSLKGATPEIAMVIGKAHEVFGDLGELSVPTVFGGMITGGDISPDGLRVALCDYVQGYEIALPDA